MLCPVLLAYSIPTPKVLVYCSDVYILLQSLSKKIITTGLEKNVVSTLQRTLFDTAGVEHYTTSGMLSIVGERAAIADAYLE